MGDGDAINRLRTFSTASISFAESSVLREPYAFSRDDWTPVYDASDYQYLRRQSMVILEEEYPLCECGIVEYKADQKITVCYSEDGAQESLEFRPNEQKTLDWMVARFVASRPNFRFVPLLERDVSEDSRVLFIRNGNFGDVLLTTPVLRELSTLRPDLELHCVTAEPYCRVYEGLPYVEQAHTFDDVYEYAPWDYVVEWDAVVELADDGDSVHRTDLFGRAAGIDRCDNYHLDYRIEPEDREWARDGLGELSTSGPFVVVQVKGSMPRRTPSKDKLLEIMSGLRENGYVPIAIDNHRDEFWDREGIVNMTGQFDISQLMGLLAEVGMVLAGDSGVVHAANAIDVSVVGLFGPVHPDLRVRGHDNCRTLFAGDYRDCAPCDDSPTCSDERECLDIIPTDLILNTIEGAM